MIKVGEEGVGEGRRKSAKWRRWRKSAKWRGVEEEQTLEVGEVVEVAL
jgi:hypothetical protein